MRLLNRLNTSIAPFFIRISRIINLAKTRSKIYFLQAGIIFESVYVALRAQTLLFSAKEENSKNLAAGKILSLLRFLGRDFLCII